MKGERGERRGIGERLHFAVQVHIQLYTHSKYPVS